MTLGHHPLRTLIALVLVVVLAGLAGAVESPKPGQSPKAASASAKRPPKPAVDPRALEILNRACKSLSSVKGFTYHAEINFDSVLPSDIKLQFAAAMDVAIQRPDQLAVDYASDLVESASGTMAKQ